MSCAAVALALGCGAAAPPPEAPAPPPPVGPAMRVHLINVGQGAATLIEFSCGAMLIDTGGEENPYLHSTTHLLHYLDAFFALRPDLNKTLALLVITHPHIDHDRNAMEVFQRYHVLNVVTDGLTPNAVGGPEQAALIAAATQAGIGVRAIEAKAIQPGGLTDGVIDPIACPDVDPDIRVLWGAASKDDVHWPDDVFDNANNHSVVTKVTFGKSSVIVTGDLQAEGISALLARHQGTNALAADVYEVGHHGSHNGTTRELLDAIHPKLALIAVGAPLRPHQIQFTAWQFGHPRADVIDMLQPVLTGAPRTAIKVQVAEGTRYFGHRTITAPIYATAWDGTVTVMLGADGNYAVATQQKRTR